MAVSPATAFCSSLRQATVAKSADSSTAQRVPCNASTTRFACGTSGSVRRGLARSQTEASGSRCAGNQTTDGSTVAPLTHGSNWAFCSTPFCRAQTTVFSSHRARSHPALSAFCVVFTATKTRSAGRVTTDGSVNTGPGTTVSPSSSRRRSSGCAVRPHNCGVRPASCSTAAIVVPIAPGPISAITGLSDMVNSPFR